MFGLANQGGDGGETSYKKWGYFSPERAGARGGGRVLFEGGRMLSEEDAAASSVMVIGTQEPIPALDGLDVATCRVGGRTRDGKAPAETPCDLLLRGFDGIRRAARAVGDTCHLWPAGVFMDGGETMRGIKQRARPWLERFGLAVF